MTNFDRRLAKLEQGAPSGITRPEGLAGEPFLIHVLDEIRRSEGTEREQAIVRCAWLDLMTHDELRDFEALVRAAMVAIAESDANSTSSGDSA
jgi:hypothetical protein